MSGVGFEYVRVDGRMRRGVSERQQQCHWHKAGTVVRILLCCAIGNVLISATFDTVPRTCCYAVYGTYLCFLLPKFAQLMPCGMGCSRLPGAAERKKKVATVSSMWLDSGFGDAAAKMLWVPAKQRW